MPCNAFSPSVQAGASDGEFWVNGMVQSWVTIGCELIFSKTPVSSRTNKFEPSRLPYLVQKWATLASRKRDCSRRKSLNLGGVGQPVVIPPPNISRRSSL